MIRHMLGCQNASRFEEGCIEKSSHELFSAQHVPDSRKSVLLSQMSIEAEGMELWVTPILLALHVPMTTGARLDV